MHLLVRARFNDPGSGGKVYPKSYDYTISVFVMAAEHAGLRFDEMSEHLIADELVSTNPRAAGAIGWPLLLAMKLSQA